jgi:serine/threonine protein kinase/Flp pilus assembly protein TadD
MKTVERRVCASCGNEFSGAMEFCPVCMLRKALAANETESGAFSSEDTVKPAPEQSAQRFEHYELVKGEDGKPVELGRGAMGVTYRAVDTILGHTVALKVIDASIAAHAEARERFLREARTAARLRHPNVASVFYYGMRKSDEQCFYAMELVEGETLEAHLRRTGPLPAALALEVIAQVARSLVAAEALGLVHRDLKPANLMLVEGAELSVKVIDFGLAKAATGTSETNLTHGGFVGTPAFASPEQFIGTGVDVRSDLYSLGVILWGMLAGKLPFEGSSAELIFQHQHTPLPLEQLKGVPQPVAVLVETLLEKDPLRRFQSATELLNALVKVTSAIKEARSITRQSFEVIENERLRALRNSREQLRMVPDLLTSSRFRLIVWPAIVLLICGGAILAMNIFFGPKGPTPQTSTNSSTATPGPEKSIAVLPFESLSDNKSDTYFADGVQDEILSNLAKVGQLKVISRTSVMTYRRSGNRDLRSIAGALGVANVVEGTVRRDGNRVRVTTELIDAGTDKTLWSVSFDRDLTDIFAIQSEIARTVASKLSAQMSPEEKQSIAEKPTNDLEAYDLYLQAKELIANSMLFSMGDERNSLLNAIRLLEEATRKDVKFALAYCLIARAHDDLYSLDFDNTPERRARGDAAVNEALRLRPDLPEVHIAMAFHLYKCYGNYERAIVQVAIAQQALPNSPDALALAAYLDGQMGKWEKSTGDLERAIVLDPKNSELLSSLARNYLCLRRYRDAAQTYDRLIELESDKATFKAKKAYGAFVGKAEFIGYRDILRTLPPSLKNFFMRIYMEVFARDWPAAKEILRSDPYENLPLYGGMMVPRECVEIWLAYLRGDHPRMEGRFAVARNQLNRKVEMHPEDSLLLSELGIIDAALGRKAEAINEAKRALEMPPSAPLP